MSAINPIFSKNIASPNIVVNDVATERSLESFSSVLTLVDVEFIVSIGRSMGVQCFSVNIEITRIYDIVVASRGLI
mgnify:CR=1 FL=1